MEVSHAPSEMDDVDSADAENPAAVTDYVAEIYQNFQKAEVSNASNAAEKALPGSTSIKAQRMSTITLRNRINCGYTLRAPGVLV
jgi:hypothetical protein